MSVNTGYASARIPRHYRPDFSRGVQSQPIIRPQTIGQVQTVDVVATPVQLPGQAPRQIPSAGDFADRARQRPASPRSGGSGTHTTPRPSSVGPSPTSPASGGSSPRVSNLRDIPRSLYQSLPQGAARGLRAGAGAGALGAGVGIVATTIGGGDIGRAIFEGAGGIVGGALGGAAGGLTSFGFGTPVGAIAGSMGGAAAGGALYDWLFPPRSGWMPGDGRSSPDMFSPQQAPPLANPVEAVAGGIYRVQGLETSFFADRQWTDARGSEFLLVPPFGATFLRRRATENKWDYGISAWTRVNMSTGQPIPNTTGTTSEFVIGTMTHTGQGQPSFKLEITPISIPDRPPEEYPPPQIFDPNSPTPAPTNAPTRAPAVSPSPTPSPTPTPSPPRPAPAPNPFPVPPLIPVVAPAPPRPGATPNPGNGTRPFFRLPSGTTFWTGNAPRGTTAVSPNAPGNAQTPNIPGRNTTINTPGTSGSLTCRYSPAIDQQILANTNETNQTLSVIQTVILARIDAKLGPQIPNGGLAGFLKRFWDSFALQKFLSILTFVTVLHNAMMLSNNIAQTLFSAFDTIFELPWFKAYQPKDAEGQNISTGDFVGNVINNLAVQLFGDQTVATVKKAWNKASRIYQAAANIVWSIQSIGYSILEALEVVGNYVALIGNALRRFGAVAEKAYGWMNPNLNFMNSKFFRGLDAVQEGVEAIETVASETLSVVETVDELKNQRKELVKAVSDSPDDEPETPDATAEPYTSTPEQAAIAAKETEARDASQGANIGQDDLNPPSSPDT